MKGLIRLDAVELILVMRIQKHPNWPSVSKLIRFSLENLSTISDCGLSSGHAVSCCPLFAAVWAYSYATPVPLGSIHDGPRIIH